MARVALLIDAENVPVTHFEQIMRRTDPIGTIAIRRVFGDFSHERLADWQNRAVAAGFSIAHEPTAGPGKNSTDIRLTVDAMEIAATDRVDSFCIVSSDRDFLPLVRHLRERDFDVHGMGCSTSDKRLQSACSKFFVLDQPQKAPQALAPAAPRPKTVIATNAKSLTSLKDREALVGLLRAMFETAGGPIRPSAFATELRRVRPDLADKLGGPGIVKRLANQGLAQVASEGDGQALRPMPELKLVK